MKKIIIIIGISLVALSVNAQSWNWDASIVRSIQSTRTGSLDKGMNFISNSAYFFVPSIPVGLMATGFGKKDDKLWSGSIQMSIGLASSALLSLGVKEIIQRDRPFTTHPDISNVGNESGYSMPSAHTSFAFSLATSLSLMYPNWYVIVPSYLWAAGVSFSRMYLGVHYPTDIVVGILVGVASAFIGYYLFPNTPNNNRFLLNSPNSVF